MSESLECIGSESNMQIPSETRSKQVELQRATGLKLPFDELRDRIDDVCASAGGTTTSLNSFCGTDFGS